jgi:hypothetical protein
MLKQMLNLALEVLMLWATIPFTIRGLTKGEFQWRPVFGPKAFLYRRGENPEFWVLVVVGFGIAFWMAYELIRTIFALVA